MTCPDKDCHDKLKAVCTAIHHPDTGLATKMPKSTFTKNLISVIGIIAGFVLVGLGAYNATSNRIADNKTNVAVIEAKVIESLKNINSKLDDLKNTQVTKEDIHRAISERISNRRARD